MVKSVTRLGLQQTSSRKRKTGRKAKVAEAGERLGASHFTEENADRGGNCESDTDEEDGAEFDDIPAATNDNRTIVTVISPGRREGGEEQDAHFKYEVSGHLAEVVAESYFPIPIQQSAKEVGYHDLQEDKFSSVESVRMKRARSVSTGNRKGHYYVQ
ncbi:hypothetical protein FS837_001918, partial [Tulasnella sp. UAMH 9824]